MNAETLQQRPTRKSRWWTPISPSSRASVRMSRDRWETLGKQLADLKMIERAPDASQVFVAPNPK